MQCGDAVKQKHLVGGGFESANFMRPVKTAPVIVTGTILRTTGPDIVLLDSWQ